MTHTFDAIAGDFIAGYFHFYPHRGSEKGFTATDSLAPLFDRNRLSEFRRLVASTRSRLATLAPTGPTDIDANVDRQVITASLRLADLQLDELELFSRQPHLFVEASLESIETLRMRSAGGEALAPDCYRDRLNAVATNLAAARDSVTQADIVSLRIAREMAVEGSAELASSQDLSTMGAPVAMARAGAVHALRRFAAWLDEETGRATPFQPMGHAAFERVLQSEHALDEGVSYWQNEAERFLAETSSFAGPPPSNDDRKLERSFPGGVSPRDIWRFYVAEIELLEQLIAERDIVDVPPGELTLAPSPAFLAEVNGAGSYHPPPAFSASHTGFFFVAPVPDKLHDDDIEHFRRRYERRTFLTLAVHEAFPGHHVHFLHAMNHHSPVRKFRDFDIFVEGWAHYCEEMMWHEALSTVPGYQFPIRSLRFRALRVLVDSALHTGDLSPKEAGRLMADRMGVDPGPWIAREIQRYAVDPGQAFSYFVGKRIIERLRRERQARDGAAFRLSDFHHDLLAEGAIPVHLCREKWIGVGGG